MSPANLDTVKERATDNILYYRAARCVNADKAQAKESIATVVNCIGTNETAAFCANVLSSRGGAYRAIKALLHSVFRELRLEPG